MRTRLSLMAALTTLVLAGAACDGGSDDRATDPAGESGDSSPASSGPPAPAVPEGPVRTGDLATVMAHIRRLVA